MKIRESSKFWYGLQSTTSDVIFNRGYGPSLREHEFIGPRASFREEDVASISKVLNVSLPGA